MSKMIIKIIVFIFLLCFHSVTVTVGGLKCYTCQFTRETKLDKEIIEGDPSCETGKNLDPSLSVDCEEINDGPDYMFVYPFDSCLTLKLTGQSIQGSLTYDVDITLRICAQIPLESSFGVSRKCFSNSDSEIGTGAEEEAVRDLYQTYPSNITNLTQAEACLCSEKNCNGLEHPGERKSIEQNATVRKLAEQEAGREMSTTLGGNGAILQSTTAILLILHLIVSCNNIRFY